MAYVADRVKQTTTTTGTGSVSLNGTVDGYQTFAAAFSTGATAYYGLVDGAAWEIGIGTFTAGSPGSVSRDTVLSSSAGGSKISLSAGTKDVFVTAPAARIAMLAPDGSNGSSISISQLQAALAALVADPRDRAGAAASLDLMLTDPAGLPVNAFSRASSATWFDARGALRTAAAETPRFQHDPVTGALQGLLIEDARTNVCWPSSDFSHANWAKQYVTLAAGETAPDGTALARVVETSDTSIHRLLYGFSSTAQTWTASGFVKAAERRYLMIRMWDGSIEIGARFDFQSGTVPLCDNGVVARIRSVGNGIWRWSNTRTLAGVGSSLSIYMLDDVGAASYAGSAASAVQVWGVQIEQGAYPSSYIPTATGQATRAADLTTVSAADLPALGGESGTLYAEFAVPAVTGGQDLLLLSNASASDHVRLRVEVGAVYASANAGSASLFQSSLGAPVTDAVRRAALAWDGAGWSAQMQGGELKTGALSSHPAGLDRLCVGHCVGGNHLGGFAARVLFWPRRLSDAVITSLVTP